MIELKSNQGSNEVFKCAELQQVRKIPSFIERNEEYTRLDFEAKKIFLTNNNFDLYFLSVLKHTLQIFISGKSFIRHQVQAKTTAAGAHNLQHRDANFMFYRHLYDYDLLLRRGTFAEDVILNSVMSTSCLRLNFISGTNFHSLSSAPH